MCEFIRASRGSVRNGLGLYATGLSKNRERTSGEVRKCSMRIDGSSTKSVAQRVPAMFPYSVRPIIAAMKMKRRREVRDYLTLKSKKKDPTHNASRVPVRAKA